MMIMIIGLTFSCCNKFCRLRFFFTFFYFWQDLFNTNNRTNNTIDRLKKKKKKHEPFYSKESKSSEKKIKWPLKELLDCYGTFFFLLFKFRFFFLYSSFWNITGLNFCKKWLTTIIDWSENFSMTTTTTSGQNRMANETTEKNIGPNLNREEKLCSI